MKKHDLKMKPVSSQYMEQYNALLRYVFQVTDRPGAFRHRLAGKRNHPCQISNDGKGRCHRLV